jgi:hypothetical protein
MDDKKRLNAEAPRTISQAEKDAWQRSKNDALKNLKLANLDGLSPEKAIQIVKLYADSGNEQFIRQKLSIPISDIRKVLTKFNIKSIEDAKSIVKTGIIAQLDEAVQADKIEADQNQVKQTEADKEKLKAHEQKFASPQTTAEEKDKKLKVAQEEAFRKNKADKIRNLIAQGIEADSESNFRIELADITAFKSMIPYGVSQLQRRFGGSKKDIVNEIKRLSPSTDISMLRP